MSPYLITGFGGAGIVVEKHWGDAFGRCAYLSLQSPIQRGQTRAGDCFTQSWAHSTGNPFVANETGSSILIFVDNHYSTVKYHRQHLNLEAFSPEVEKRLCNFFESKGFSVCNAFSIQN